MNIPLPTKERLEQLYTYNPDTGELISNRYKRPLVNRNYEGRLMVNVDKKQYYGARVIWRLVTGEDCGELMVEHADNNPSNNRWTNLRLATSSQNCQNRAARGYCWDTRGQRFIARIQHEGVTHTTYHLTEEEARDWYVKKCNELHGEFSHVL